MPVRGAPEWTSRADMADAADRLTSAGRWIATAVFVAMLVGGMDLQMLSLSLSSISKELNLSSVSRGQYGRTASVSFSRSSDGVPLQPGGRTYRTAGFRAWACVLRAGQ